MSILGRNISGMVIVPSTQPPDHNKIKQYSRFAILGCFLIDGGLSGLCWDPFDTVVDDGAFIIGF